MISHTAKLPDVLQLAPFPDIDSIPAWNSKNVQTHISKGGGYSYRESSTNHESYRVPRLAKQLFASPVKSRSRSPSKCDQKMSQSFSFDPLSNKKHNRGSHGIEKSMQQCSTGVLLIFGGFLLWLVLTWFVLWRGLSRLSDFAARKAIWLHPINNAACQEAERFGCLLPSSVETLLARSACLIHSGPIQLRSAC
jgi:hypothetical protein